MRTTLQAFFFVSLILWGSQVTLGRFIVLRKAATNPMLSNDIEEFTIKTAAEYAESLKWDPAETNEGQHMDEEVTTLYEPVEYPIEHIQYTGDALRGMIKLRTVLAAKNLKKMKERPDSPDAAEPYLHIYPKTNVKSQAENSCNRDEPSITLPSKIDSTINCTTDNANKETADDSVKKVATTIILHAECPKESLPATQMIKCNQNATNSPDTVFSGQLVSNVKQKIVEKPTQIAQITANTANSSKVVAITKVVPLPTDEIATTAAVTQPPDEDREYYENLRNSLKKHFINSNRPYRPVQYTHVENTDMTDFYFEPLLDNFVPFSQFKRAEDMENLNDKRDPKKTIERTNYRDDKLWQLDSLKPDLIGLTDLERRFLELH